MRQAIHIFRKDARRCWPHIAAVLALTAAAAWAACRDILPGPPFGEPVSLLPLAWFFAIGAAVQGESLAGDRQFWVTRPYSWKSLLAAKLLFVGAFVGLPILLSDWVVLVANGFDPLTPVPGLMLRQGWLAAYLALPFAAAALTRTLRDFVLAGLAFSILIMLEGRLFGFRLSMMGMEPEWIRDSTPWLFPVVGLSLAVWQFARRRTTMIRVLALAAIPWVPFWTVPSLARPTGPIVPYEPRFRNVTIQFDPGRGHKYPGGIGGRFYIPVTIAGWPNDLLECHPLGGNRFMRDGPFGLYCVTSGQDGGAWLVLNPAAWLPANGDLSVPMDLGVYEQQASVSLPSDGGWVRIPGFGGVRLREEKDGTVIMARTPLWPAGPEWTYRLGGLTEDGSWSRLPSDLAPVVPTPLAFRNGSVGLVQSQVYRHGTLPHPVIFSARRLAAVLHRELKIAQIRLADYEVQKP
jgi:hypothetical protein